MEHSGVSLFSAIVGAVVAYFIGYGYAVLKRANKDYRNTKALVPGLRKNLWSSFGAFLKAAAVGVVLLLALAAWVVRDVSGREASRPAAPASAAPTPRPAR